MRSGQVEAALAHRRQPRTDVGYDVGHRCAAKAAVGAGVPPGVVVEVRGQHGGRGPAVAFALPIGCVRLQGVAGRFDGRVVELVAAQWGARRPERASAGDDGLAGTRGSGGPSCSASRDDAGQVRARRGAGQEQQAAALGPGR